MVVPAAAAVPPVEAAPDAADGTLQADAKVAVVPADAEAPAWVAVVPADAEAPAWVALGEELRGAAARLVPHCAGAGHCAAVAHLAARCPWARFHVAVVGRPESAPGPYRACRADPLEAVVLAARAVLVADAAAVLHVRSAGWEKRAAPAPCSAICHWAPCPAGVRCRSDPADAARYAERSLAEQHSAQCSQGNPVAAAAEHCGPEQTGWDCLVVPDALDRSAVALESVVVHSHSAAALNRVDRLAQVFRFEAVDCPAARLHRAAA